MISSEMATLILSFQTTLQRIQAKLLQNGVNMTQEDRRFWPLAIAYLSVFQMEQKLGKDCIQDFLYAFCDKIDFSYLKQAGGRHMQEKIERMIRLHPDATDYMG